MSHKHQATIDIETLGYAAQVWAGWVWIDLNRNECRWSKSATKEGCESAVADVAERLGADAVTAED